MDQKFANAINLDAHLRSYTVCRHKNSIIPNLGSTARFKKIVNSEKKKFEICQNVKCHIIFTFELKLVYGHFYIKYFKIRKLNRKFVISSQKNGINE